MATGIAARPRAVQEGVAQQVGPTTHAGLPPEKGIGTGPDQADRDASLAPGLVSETTVETILNRRTPGPSDAPGGRTAGRSR